MEILYPFPKGTSLLLILSQIHVTQASPYYVFKAYFNIILPYIQESSSFFSPSHFPMNTLYVFFIPFTSVISSPLYVITWWCLVMSTNQGRHYDPPPLLGPRVLLSNTLILHSSINKTNSVSHPQKTKGKVIILQILIFVFRPKQDNK